MDEMRRMMLEQMQGGGAQAPQPGPQVMPQMPDQGQQLQQRLQQRLNPRIGTMQDSNPEALAQFIVKNDPQKASSLLTRIIAMMNSGGRPTVPTNPNGFPMGGG